MGAIRDEFVEEWKKDWWGVTKTILHVILVFGFGIGMLVVASML